MPGTRPGMTSFAERPVLWLLSESASQDEVPDLVVRSAAPPTRLDHEPDVIVPTGMRLGGVAQAGEEGIDAFEQRAGVLAEFA